MNRPAERLKTVIKNIFFRTLSTFSIFEKFARSYLLHHRTVGVTFVDEKRRVWLDLIKRAYEQDGRPWMVPYESYVLLMAVDSVQKLSGFFAEVGVFRGGSAELICELKGDRPLHLFDSFEGLPEPGGLDSSSEFYQGRFSDTGYRQVCDRLAGYKNVFVHQGWFPETADCVKNDEFCLVHIDVDLYETTRSALEFFYPRMVPGGVIISHDYVTADGVRKAVDEFCADKCAPVLVVSDTQCLIVKT
ncbi:MAG: macrocin-O-methyltransferase [Acidobacteria bacterium]|nr:MAG: macrocin-O-methyltransferase [Acidobacteriota bacterium]